VKSLLEPTGHDNAAVTQMSNSHIFPVSFAQERLLFLERLDPGTSAYNLTRVIRMIGQLDAEALAQALDEIVKRHATLRTRFSFDAEDCYQIVDDAVRVHLPVHDISHLPAPDRQPEALRLARQQQHTSFDLTKGPLFRPVLLRLGSADHILVLVMHHIVTDGWSMGILFDEIGETYGELAHSKLAKLPVLSIQYSDFARWQREHFTAQHLRDHVAYWTNKLRGHGGFIELPTDRPRPAVQSHEGATEIFQIEEQLAQALSRLAESRGATLFMILLAAFQTLIYRYTRSEDILVGTPIASRGDVSLEKLIGFFVNTLVIRGDLSGDPSFVELLRRTRETTIEAYEHQDLPFETLVEAFKPQRSLSYTPLFQVMFVLQNTPKQTLDLSGLSLEELEFDNGSAKFDLTLEVVEQGDLHCTIEYCTALFDKPTIQRLAQHFETLLDDILRNPDRPISEFCILNEAGRRELLIEFNATEAEYRRNARLDRIFEEQVERTPDRVALVEGEIEINYRDLNARATGLARLLVKKQLGQNRPVGVYMERSIDAVVAFLAALKANTPYIPLDVSNPKHRLELLIRDSGCGVILTHRGLSGRLSRGVETMSLGDLNFPDDGSRRGLPADGTCEDLAYIIYTSGSTGVPKGVEGSHRAAINRFEWMWRTYPFSAGDTCCQKTALGFVDSVWEIFGPLLGGVRSVVVPDDSLLDLDKFIALLGRYDVTRIVLVPSLLRAVLDVVPDIARRLPKLTLWSSSGEVLSPELVRRFREVLPTATLLNIYGSSEVSADVAVYEVHDTNGLESVPIGRPISNTQIFVLDRFQNLVPPLVRGEIYVGGDCLARGYWKQPELTTQRFIRNRLRPDRSQCLFATGDCGRVLANGTIEYLGRLDLQIKFLGIRIEPGEIEANLTAHPLVRDAVVAVRSDASETQRLVAYVVRSEGPSSLAEELRSFLRARLPEYMIPAVFVELDRMPLLPSGKTDRLALPSPSVDHLGKRRTTVYARTDVERTLSSIWCEVLELDQVGIDDDFFDLGGHSLSGMRVVARVRRDFLVDVPIRTLFDRSTIAELAVEIEKLKAAGATTALPAIAPAAPSSPAPLNILRAQLNTLSPDEVKSLLQSILAEKDVKLGDKNY
jgi:amino acid adenylation domain-containing protein